MSGKAIFTYLYTSMDKSIPMKMTATFVLSLSLLATAHVCAADVSLNIGSRRELFVDHYLIDKMHDACLSLHHPRDEGSVLKFDEPWEGLFCIYSTVIKDGAK